jgi:hypothetical protein
MIGLRNLLSKGLKPLKNFELLKFILIGLKGVKGASSINDKT